MNDHERGSLGNSKVPEPLGGGGSHETIMTCAVVEDYSSSSQTPVYTVNATITHSQNR